jgi:hypothetical protein|nr:hypothetical protein [Kofleriaceae bacterium]
MTPIHCTRTRRWVVASLLVLAGACSSKPSLNDHADGGAPGGDASTPGADAATPVDAMSPVDAGAPGDPVAALKALPGTCSLDGWCWQSPTPSGVDYLVTFSTGEDNIWIGGQGSILQWDGTTWRQHHLPVPAGVDKDLAPNYIGGTSASDMWLVCANALVHWDGTAWTLVDFPPGSGVPKYVGLYVAPNGDAWVSESNGYLVRWRGGTSTKYAVPSGISPGNLWGTSSTDLFVGTLPGGILQFDGTTFTFKSVSPEIVGGFEGSHDDVWASGGGGYLWHWDGTAWTESTLPAGINPKQQWLFPIGYVAANDVWWFTSGFLGGFLHWDGTSLAFTQHTNSAGGTEVTGSAYLGDRFWFTGRKGYVATMTVPYVIDNITADSGDPFTWSGEGNGLFAAADDDVYIAFGRQLRHWDGHALTAIPLDDALGFTLGSGGVGSFEGLAGLRTNGVDELFLSGYQDDDATGVATTFTLHFDGTTWTNSITGMASTPNTSTGAWHFTILGPGEAFATGQFGYAAHFIDGAWQPVATGTTTELTGVFSPDADHVWACGLGGVVLGWDRANPGVMTPVAVGTTEDLGPMSGSPGDTWIAEAATSTIWRNTGSGWSESAWQFADPGGYAGGMLVTDPNTATISSISQNNLWQWDGSAWNFENTGDNGGLPLISQAPGGHLWISGQGLIVHQTP